MHWSEKRGEGIPGGGRSSWYNKIAQGFPGYISLVFPSVLSSTHFPGQTHLHPLLQLPATSDKTHIFLAPVFLCVCFFFSFRLLYPIFYGTSQCQTIQNHSHHLPSLYFLLVGQARGWATPYPHTPSAASSCWCELLKCHNFDPLHPLLEDTTLVSAFIISHYYCNSSLLRFPASCLSFSRNKHTVNTVKVKSKSKLMLLSYLWFWNDSCHLQENPNFPAGQIKTLMTCLFPWPQSPILFLAHCLGGWGQLSWGWLKFTNLRTLGHKG